MSALIEREAERLRQLSQRAGVHTAVLDEDATERYEVPHLSAPGLEDLPKGRDR
ncbi:hypothetical protein ACFVH6_05030 [Spirillospora sp. NPDC127200]